MDDRKALEQQHRKLERQAKKLKAEFDRRQKTLEQLSRQVNSTQQ